MMPGVIPACQVSLCSDRLAHLQGQVPARHGPGLGLPSLAPTSPTGPKARPPDLPPLPSCEPLLPGGLLGPLGGTGTVGRPSGLPSLPAAPLPPAYCDVDDQLSLMEAGQWTGPGPGRIGSPPGGLPGGLPSGSGLTVVPCKAPCHPRMDMPLPAGTIFRLIFMGSVEVEEEGAGRKRRKRLKKTMVEEAVGKIKVCGLSVHNPVSMWMVVVFLITFLFIFGFSHSFS